MWGTKGVIRVLPLLLLCIAVAEARPRRLETYYDDDGFNGDDGYRGKGKGKGGGMGMGKGKGGMGMGKGGKGMGKGGKGGMGRQQQGKGKGKGGNVVGGAAPTFRCNVRGTTDTPEYPWCPEGTFVPNCQAISMGIVESSSANVETYLVDFALEIEGDVSATLERVEAFLQEYVATDLAGCGDTYPQTGKATVESVTFEIVEDTESDPYCDSCTNADVTTDVYYSGSDSSLLESALLQAFIDRCDEISDVDGVARSYDPCPTIQVTKVVEDEGSSGGHNGDGDGEDGGSNGGGGSTGREDDDESDDNEEDPGEGGYGAGEGDGEGHGDGADGENGDEDGNGTPDDENGDGGAPSDGSGTDGSNGSDGEDGEGTDGGSGNGSDGEGDVDEATDRGSEGSDGSEGAVNGTAPIQVEETQQASERGLEAGGKTAIALSALLLLLLLLLCCCHRRILQYWNGTNHKQLEEDDVNRTFISDTDGSSPRKNGSYMDDDSVLGSRVGMYPEGQTEGMILGARSINQDVHKCSSATCKLCEARRQSGLQFLPIKGPVKVPNLTYTMREYETEDTVNL